ncbi:MAG: Putative tRNA (cytidine(34)-2'-O)-methyltransferase [Caldanaerobacter subterraneus]|uniref:Putative tRNA (cytidine(34)-2'-O)-methyltransferase n=1 Tax=Caldanaerobacter subterraneus TaxID=911092 RepID=A0A101E4U1_9THEO|nr:tRNA (uridine(34)/cytosine(34)/5-carboxymethylaminomethyluridine(34)-2'-O)-methyltransferase TrmL [Caldanaerobacter subterraneus]KUK08647.1 MAG: Putative tRNA (cytidine(34)-2'-O)-methyltransferase [Caldanaerobacter subterraneus]HBT49064.1 tRNA (uridine(34)/cytosine(34)/5-carboxymethylaminomethyluridine(34)-2'-O)-methyltransferase TrmL [Caldanaerobacter subterraneus]
MPLNVVLVEPEIPQNTGNIARTCVLTGSRLHLVKPLGFSIDEKDVRRAGLDYWPLLDLTVYESLQEFLEKHKGKKFYLATTRANKYYHEVTYEDETFLIFGKETTGLPQWLIDEYYEDCIRIPMHEKILWRSLNLSNSVAIIVYEALKQLGFPNMR